MEFPNKIEFDKACVDLERGTQLNLRMIGNVFGPDFWELIVVCMANVQIKTDKVVIELNDK